MWLPAWINVTTTAERYCPEGQWGDRTSVVHERRLGTAYGNGVFVFFCSWSRGSGFQLLFCNARLATYLLLALCFLLFEQHQQHKCHYEPHHTYPSPHLYISFILFLYFHVSAVDGAAVPLDKRRSSAAPFCHAWRCFSAARSIARQIRGLHVSWWWCWGWWWAAPLALALPTSSYLTLLFTLLLAYSLLPCSLVMLCGSALLKCDGLSILALLLCYVIPCCAVLASSSTSCVLTRLREERCVWVGWLVGWPGCYLYISSIDAVKKSNS
ncbi:hypothetical protein IWX47DRAFT_141589 [Phyllosticta citricarpa]